MSRLTPAIPDDVAERRSLQRVADANDKQRRHALDELVEAGSMNLPGVTPIVQVSHHVDGMVVVNVEGYVILRVKATRLELVSLK